MKLGEGFQVRLSGFGVVQVLGFVGCSLFFVSISRDSCSQGSRLVYA